MSRPEDGLFETIFNQHSAVMLLVEPHSGRILKANRAAALFYGHSQAELGTLAIQDLNMLSPEEVMHERNRALDAHCNHFIFPHRLASGETRTVEVHSSPIEWGGSTVLFSIVHDVSARVAAEQNLLQSESRFRTFFDDAPDAIFVAGVEDGVIQDANLAATRLLGKDLRRIRGMHFTELHPPEQSAQSRQNFHEHSALSATSPGRSIEHEVLRDDGTRVPVEVSAHALEFKGQSLLYGIFRDISERRQLEQALVQSEERMRLAFDGTNDGLWDWDLRSDSVFYSAGWKRMLGHEAHEIPDRPEEWAKRVHPEDLERVNAELQRHLRGETEVYGCQYRLQHKDGSWRWVHGRGKVMERDPAGRPLRVVGT
ncbi:MAG: PAS domain S-box protein, partial [Candidatus Cloacimonetes bacterium]|nr:PAS domain S-box protein [Candidatus Cloacimonadota bacterium]